MTKINNPENGGNHAVKLIPHTKDQIKADQDKIRTGLLSLDAAIHANAVQCLMHAEKHGDTSLMRRLLIEVVDAKTGYRRQGLINWMRMWSPMELAGGTINLSGLDAQGARRAFQIDKANAEPFWNNANNAERVAKPVYQDTLISGVERSVNAILAAIENTQDGKPIDPTKPFFDGLNAPKVVDFAKRVKEMAAEVPADPTLAVRKAAKVRDDAQRVIDHNAKLTPTANVDASSSVVGEAVKQVA